MNNRHLTAVESLVDTKKSICNLSAGRELCTSSSPGSEVGANAGQMDTLKVTSIHSAAYDSVMDFGKLTFIKNSRGKFVVYVNGYRYVKQNEAHQKTYWKCSLAVHSSKEVADNSGKAGCPGRLNIDIQGRATVTKGHNHLPDYDKQEQEEALARMKERMRREGCSAKEVYQLEASKQAQTGQAAPNYKNVQSILYRTKKRLADEESPSMVTTHISPGVLLGAGPVDTGSVGVDSIVGSPQLDLMESDRNNVTAEHLSGNLLQQFIFSDAAVGLLECNNSDMGSSNSTKRARTTNSDESVVAKTCAWGLCTNTTDNADLLPPDLTFIRFPNSRRDPDRCKLWLKQCDRKMKIEEVTAWTSVCSIHFHGGAGPTVEHPDPLPAERTYQKAFHSARLAEASRIAEESFNDVSTIVGSMPQLPRCSEVSFESLHAVSIKEEPSDSLSHSLHDHDQDHVSMLPGLNSFDVEAFLLRYVPVEVVLVLRLAALDQPRLLANLKESDLNGIEDLCRLHAAALPKAERSRLVGVDEIFQDQPQNYRLLPGYRIALNLAAADLRAHGWGEEPQIDNFVELSSLLRQNLQGSAADELYLQIGSLDRAVELRCARCQRVNGLKTCVIRVAVSQFDQLLKTAFQHMKDCFLHK